MSSLFHEPLSLRAIIREIASNSENRPCVYGTNVRGDIREVRLA